MRFGAPVVTTSSDESPLMSQGPLDSQTSLDAVDHATWWKQTEDDEARSPPATDVADVSPHYNEADATASLQRAARLVLVLAVCGMVVAFTLGGWRAAVALAVGAAISGSGLWEWRRLMAALTGRADAAEQVQSTSAGIQRPAPSIAFAITGFTVRLLVVMAVLYGSLSYLHGSVAALAAGLLMGVIALTIEGIRLLRSGTI